MADLPSTGLLSADDEAAALERLHDLGCTDGLPVVIPTPYPAVSLVQLRKGSAGG